MFETCNFFDRHTRRRTGPQFQSSTPSCAFHSVTHAPLVWNIHRRPMLWHLLRQASTSTTSHIWQIYWLKKKTTPVHQYVSELWNEPHHNYHKWDESQSIAYYRMSEKLRLWTQPPDTLFLVLGSTAVVGLGILYEVPASLSHTPLGSIPLDGWSARRKGLYQTINTHNRTRNPSNRMALDRAATGIGTLV